MANSFKGRTWIIDTPSATPIWKGNVKVKSIYWKGPTTIGHTAVLQRSDGSEFRSFVCEVAAESQFMLIESWVDGLIIPTLASGVLEIEIC